MRVVLINCSPDNVNVISQEIEKRKLGLNTTIINDVIRIYKDGGNIIERSQSIILVYSIKEKVNELISVLEKMSFDFPFSINVLLSSEANLDFSDWLSRELGA